MRKAYAKDEYRELIEAREEAKHDRVSGLAQARREGEKRGRWDTLQRTYQRLIENGASSAEIQDILRVTDQEMERLTATQTLRPHDRPRG